MIIYSFLSFLWLLNTNWEYFNKFFFFDFCFYSNRVIGFIRIVQATMQRWLENIWAVYIGQL